MQSTSRIPQHPGVMPSRQRTSASVHLKMFLMAIILSCIPSSQSFNMQMGEYKPPVKSSVGKLHDGRFSRDLSSSQGNSSPSRSSSSSKSASAAGISYYEPASDLASSSTSDDSFEKRMRDMVLGNQKQREVARTATALPPTRKFARKLPPTILPPNVHKIETLQDYKTMVADETKSVVAVRFYAPWCKVSTHLVLQLFYLALEPVPKCHLRCLKMYRAQYSSLFYFYSHQHRHVELSLPCFIIWRPYTLT
jgi:hypothetical protein